MPEFQELELVDALIYLYVIWAWINMILSILFLYIIFTNWQNASRAVNPSQYKLRNKYVVSLILTIISNLVHSLVVVFGINNLIIPWNYSTLPHIYQEILIFFLALGAFSFICSMLVSFLIRISILYELSKIQSIILNSLTILIMISIVIMAVILSFDGVNLAHIKDKSSGINILRPIEASAAFMFMFMMLPLSFCCFILFSFIYSYKMKSLRNISTKNERDLMMPIVLKESILVIIACFVSILFGVAHILLNNYNVQLFGTMVFGVMLICSFSMFDFNHKIFYKLCYYPSLIWLNICCFHAKNKHDDQLLSAQFAKKPIYTDLPQQLDKVNEEINDEHSDVNSDNGQETERDSLLENDENEL